MVNTSSLPELRLGMIYIQKGIKKIEKKKEEGWVAEMLVPGAEMV